MNPLTNSDGEPNVNPKHDLYTDDDKDAPDVIRDNNGQVVLDLCKRCGRAECELDEPCIVPKPTQMENPT